MWISTLKPYGDLISAIGALLLFFSWLVTNTLGEQFKSVKNSYDNANATWRLHSRLDSIDSSIQSVSGVLVYVLQDLAQLRFESLSRPDQDKDRATYKSNDLIRRLAAIEASARQIDWGSAFCALTLEQSAVDKSRGNWVTSLQESCRSIDLLKEQKDQIIARARTSLRSVDNSSAEQGIQTADDELRPLIDEFGSLLQLAVKASNERRRELQVALHKAEARAKLAKRFAIGFYVLGSIIVLAGTAVGKFVH